MKPAHLLLFLLLSPVARANQLTAAIDKDMDDLMASDSALAMASNAGADARKDYDHLKSDVLPPLDAQKNQYQIDVAAYNAENAGVKEAMDVHNNNRCTQDSCVTAYNAERDQLNAHAIRMQARERELDQKRDELNASYTSLRANMQADVEKIKQNLDGYNLVLTNRKPVLDDLAKLQAQSATCRRQLKANGITSPAALKARCGVVKFDASNASLSPAPEVPPIP
jgi:chromosome segregation ATPase